MKALEELGISPMPWDAAEDGMGGYDIRCDMGCNRGDCEYEGEDFIAHVERDPDASIIAAAPELYEALRECEVFISSTNPHGRLIGTIRNALAKAGGAE